ncbi:S ribonuclease [Pyrus ussuriensis x Pyrus communis]|uniref:S ribonuclease n=1 Tax=Pyrus ussuriensis x Pyrus communis TaxID=2448454 RepID=A0A5N5F3B1_9ROSA|nr:S ribonuclease [Pyrus ussuriensis x Pyrus communis]
MASSFASAHTQPPRRSTQSKIARNSTGAASDDQVTIFSSTQAINVFCTVAARKVSKSRFKSFYRIWLDFIRRHVLGTSNNGPNVLELIREGQPFILV